MDTIQSKRNWEESICGCTVAAAERANMSVIEYKAITAIVKLAVVATGFYSISKGADPMTTFSIVAAVLLGPDYLETIMARESEVKVEKENTEND